MDITMCGYRCDLCKAYTPNIKSNDQRAELSRMWKKYYDLDIRAEDIYCDGCRCIKADARRVDDGCPVRRCVLDKGGSHCGDCASFPCGTWEQRRGLSREEARKRLGDDFDEAEFKEFIEAYDNGTRLAGFRSNG